MSLLEIRKLSVNYYTLSGVVNAVDNVSLSIGKGEWVSIVGESGCGKSTLAYSIVRLVPPPGKIVDGEIRFEGKNLLELSNKEFRRLLGREIGVILQDPMTSLDPLRRIGDQLAEVYMVHGVAKNKKEALSLAGDLLEKVGLTRDRLKNYPHQLSGGQRQRVAIAIAMALKPKLLIADEPTTALDVIVQENIMDLMTSFKEKGVSILFITHDIALAAERSDKIAVMYAGHLVEYGKVDDVINDPLHPYTKGLLQSTPDIWGPKKIESIPGYPPDLRNPPPGCRFYPRCNQRKKICEEKKPPVLQLGERMVMCWLYSGVSMEED